MTHGKPCVHLHVFTRHMASHVSTCMEGASSINRSVGRRRGEKERKREREERRKERKQKKKRKRKRERGRRPAVSSSVHWRFDGQNSLDQRVTSGYSTRNCATRGRFPPTSVHFMPRGIVGA